MTAAAVGAVHDVTRGVNFQLGITMLAWLKENVKKLENFSTYVNIMEVFIFV